jgi:hypothetical protein
VSAPALDASCAAAQVCTHLQAVGQACGVWVVPIVGGMSPLKQQRLLKKRPQVNHPTEALGWGPPPATHLPWCYAAAAAALHTSTIKTKSVFYFS